MSVYYVDTLGTPQGETLQWRAFPAESREPDVRIKNCDKEHSSVLVNEIIDNRFSFLFTHTVPIAPTCRTEATQLLFPLTVSSHHASRSAVSILRTARFCLQRKLIGELYDLLIC
jgi:hypothetical protein